MKKLLLSAGIIALSSLAPLALADDSSTSTDPTQSAVTADQGSTTDNAGQASTDQQDQSSDATTPSQDTSDMGDAASAD